MKSAEAVSRRFWALSRYFGLASTCSSRGPWRSSESSWPKASHAFCLMLRLTLPLAWVRVCWDSDATQQVLVPALRNIPVALTSSTSGFMPSLLFTVVSSWSGSAPSQCLTSLSSTSSSTNAPLQLLSTPHVSSTFSSHVAAHGRVDKVCCQY